MTTAFETEFARSIYEQRYKHPHDGNWEGTARRVVTHPLAALEARTGKDLSSWASEIFKLFLAKKAVPGGRYLYATGRELHQVNNCFSGDTRFITKNGPRSLQDAVGEEVEVRNRFGEWEAAEVRPFGEQELYIVRFSNGLQVKTTANHLWWQEDGTRVSTLNLQEVPFSLAASMPDLDPEGVRHGIIYGDGFLSNEGRYSKIVFVNPEKDQALVDWFADEDREITVGGGAVVNYRTVRQYKAGTCVALQPAHYKALPEACTPEYARGFIAGLIATDGTVPETGSVSISQEGLAACERIAELAVLAGCVVNSVRCVSTRSPYTGERRELGMVSIKPFSAPVILPSHVARIQARNLRQNFKMGLTVEEVSPTGETAPVYCVVAPQSESFTLANGLITSNCVLLRCPDSREGWATTSYQAEMALMTGAGIGVYYGDVRPGGAIIKKTGGVASGPLPKMQQVNETGRHTMQGGNRRSAIWAGLPWNHADVFDFITIKDWSDEVKAMKAKDWTFPAPMDMTNISVCLDDAFFEAYHNENWSNGTAIAPDGGTWHNWARRVYDTAIQHMLKHGEPGFSVDVGDKADEKLRNAPVVGSTRVLTDTGYVAVSEIVGQPVTVWTGLQWAPNVVFSENQRPDHTVEVAMTGGRSITCDPSHPFVLATGENLAAGELVPGTELLVSLPEVDVTGTLDNDAYTLGWLYGDGSFTKEGRAELTLCSDESKLCREWLSEPKSETRNDSRGYHRIYYGAGYPYTKDRVDPSIFRFTADQLVSFIAGLWDADGNYDSTQQRIRLSSKHAGFLREVGLLLEQLGIVAHVSKNGTSTYGKSQSYQLCVAADYHDLFAETIPCKRVRLAARWSSPYRKSKIKVLSVSTRPAEPVYCADVKVIEHMFVAEGVVIKNCTEITSADDSDVCNLGSLVLPRFESPEEFGRAVRAMVVFLTAGSVYSDVPYAKISEIRDSNRRLGLGLIGVHEFCMKRGVRYGTPEAFEILEPYMAEYRRALEYANEFQDSIGISRSVGATAIAPNGTIGIIAESTPSADPLFSAAERREVKVAHHSGKDEYTSHIVVDPVAKRLLSEGVPASLIEDAYTLSYDPERRFAMTAYLQQSVDHAISGTVNLPAVVTNEREAKGFGRTLLPYLPQMRGITVYPDGARAGQPRTSVDLEWAIENEGQLFTDDATCSGGVCGV